MKSTFYYNLLANWMGNFFQIKICSILEMHFINTRAIGKPSECWGVGYK